MKFIEYRGDKISKLSLGTVQFGLDYGIANSSGQPSQEKVNDIIDYVYSKKINCFDTAQAYGNSEEVLGKAITNEMSPYLISKLKSNIFQENAILSVEKSLDNLDTSILYALLLHDSALLYKWNDTYKSMVVNLKEKKLIKYFGVSIYTDEDFQLAVENDDIEFIQIPFSIFDQRAINKKWFEKAKQHNKLIFIRSIFLQGLLFMQEDELPEHLEKANVPLAIFDDYCQRLKMNRAELALSFVDSVATEALLLFGCDNLNQAKENIDNYNHIKKLEKSTINQLIDSFNSIDEQIYNPTKW